jgi:hypothetical protein
MTQTGWRGVVRPAEGGPYCMGQASGAAGARSERALGDGPEAGANHPSGAKQSRIRREHHSVQRRRREHQSVGHRRCRRGYESPQQGRAAPPSRPPPLSSPVAPRPPLKPACWHGLFRARPSCRPSEAERLRLVLHGRPGRVQRCLPCLVTDFTRRHRRI